MKITHDPNIQSKLRTVISSKSLESFENQPITNAPAPVINNIENNSHSESYIFLNQYEKAENIREAFQAYITGPWKKWVLERKQQLKTIRLYNSLFTLQQQLKEGVIDSALDVVWGVGISVWAKDEYKVTYPLLTQPCEITLNVETAAIEIKPGNSDVKLETD